MSVILAWLGVAMVAIGISAIYSGSLVFSFERGWTMVISGTVAGSAGAILVGISAALRRLRRIEGEAAKLREALAALAERFDAAPPDHATTAAEGASGSRPATPAPPDPPIPEAVPAENRPEPPIADGRLAETDKVVGSYSAGGCSYVMFADGSIRAETPSGEHRFDSMDAFKTFMLTAALQPDRGRKASDAGQQPQAGADNPTVLSAKA